MAAVRSAATVPIKKLMLHSDDLPFEHNGDCTFCEFQVECGGETHGNRDALEDNCDIEVLYIHGGHGSCWAVLDIIRRTSSFCSALRRADVQR